MIELERELPGLDRELVLGVVGRLVEAEPSAAAVVVTGSYARGTADADSDLDVRAITADTPSAPYRTWFEERQTGSPVHVSAGAKALEDWLAAAREPAVWSLGFPAEHTAAYLWATDDARARLGDPPSLLQPPATPEIEDLVEALVQVRRAAAAADGLGARWHALTAAGLVPRALLPLNPPRVVRDRREAIEAALTLEIVPEEYAGDLATALGLTTAGDGDVAEAALRLGWRVLVFLRERDPNVDPQPGVADALRDGAFERRLGG